MVSLSHVETMFAFLPSYVEDNQYDNIGKYISNNYTIYGKYKKI